MKATSILLLVLGCWALPADSVTLSLKEIRESGVVVQRCMVGTPFVPTIPIHHKSPATKRPANR
jgi:hypothetical protein